jgi:hypothetical protein
MTQRQGPGVTSGTQRDDAHVNVAIEETSEGSVYRAEPRYPRRSTLTETTMIERRGAPGFRWDKIRWGPIIAGLVTTIATMLVLTVLGLALGASVFEPTSDGDDVGTAAAIWSIASAIAAFLIGGWVAGKTASVHGDDNALLNGFMVGATALAGLLLLAGLGLGNLLGGIGTNIDEIANITTGAVGGVDTGAAAQDAQNAAIDAYDEARNGAWGTLIGMLVALGASTVGGLLGHKARHDHTGADPAYDD